MLGLTAVIAATLLWQVVADAGVVSQDFLPPPTQTWQAFCTLLRDGYRDTTLAEDIAATLGRCLAGFLLRC